MSIRPRSTFSDGRSSLLPALCPTRSMISQTRPLPPLLEREKNFDISPPPEIYCPYLSGHPKADHLVYSVEFFPLAAVEQQAEFCRPYRRSGKSYPFLFFGCVQMRGRRTLLPENCPPYVNSVLFRNFVPPLHTMPNKKRKFQQLMASPLPLRRTGVGKQTSPTVNVPPPFPKRGSLFWLLFFTQRHR